MKKLALLLLLSLVAIGVLSGCGKKRATLNPNADETIAILTLDGNLPDQTADQKTELKIVMDWMDKDIIKNLNRSGFNAILIKSKKSYKKNMGNLLVITVDDFNAGNRALRTFVNFGAGGSSLDLDYKLYNQSGKKIKSWKDGVGSSKGGTYCAQTLNVNAQNKLVELLNK